MPPLDLRVLGEAASMRGIVLDKACVATLHNANGILQLEDCLGPVHLHECIMGRRFELGCIDNLSIANRPIALIGLSRWIVLAMTVFTLASICLAASCSSRVSSDRMCADDS